MQLPREVIVGKGTLTRVSEVTKRLGLTKSALILAGHKSSKIAGNTVQRQLEQAGLTVESLIVETATMQDVTTAEQKIRQLKPQIIIGVGGGNPADKIIGKGRFCDRELLIPDIRRFIFSGFR